MNQDKKYKYRGYTSSALGIMDFKKFKISAEFKDFYK